MISKYVGHKGKCVVGLYGFIWQILIDINHIGIGIDNIFIIGIRKGYLY